jgi:hypothetical protein
MIFPSPARMSLTKLSQVGNNESVPAREIPTEDRKIVSLFSQCMYFRLCVTQNGCGLYSVLGYLLICLQLTHFR